MTSAALVRLQPLAGLQRRVDLVTHDPQADLVSAGLHAQAIWEPFETRLWLAAQRSGDLVVDVGANLGYFTVLAALNERRPRRVHAFEPEPRNVALLSENVRRNGVGALTEVHAVALANEAGKGRLHLSLTNLGDHQIYAGDGERPSVAIPVVAGGPFLEALTDRVDLLKVDTQGSEGMVVEGLEPLLLASRGSLRILLELTPFSLALAGNSGRGLIEALARLDLPMAIVDHLEHRLVPSDAEALATWCDNVAATPGDRGFMNIFIGEAPDL